MNDRFENPGIGNSMLPIYMGRVSREVSRISCQPTQGSRSLDSSSWCKHWANSISLHE